MHSLGSSEIEEKVDHLNEEFSEIAVQLLEQNNNMKELETEVLAKTDALKKLNEGSDEYKHQQEFLLLPSQQRRI